MVLAGQEPLAVLAGEFAGTAHVVVWPAAFVEEIETIVTEASERLR